jgi:hypothetical protein
MKADGVCAAADCTYVCSLVSGLMKSTSFVYVAYMLNLLTVVLCYNLLFYGLHNFFSKGRQKLCRGFY